jgi:hypothetical protein
MKIDMKTPLSQAVVVAVDYALNQVGVIALKQTSLFDSSWKRKARLASKAA